MTDIEIRLAQEEDDEELRRILRESPMTGDISLSFEREPDYFIGAQVTAPENQIIVAKDLDSMKIVGMGSRSLRPLYANAEVQTIGYLSQVRIDPNYRAMRKGLVKAFEYLHDLHRDDASSFYFTSVFEDNLPARRLFTRGLPGLPKLFEYARMHTLAIYSRRKKREIKPDSSFRIIRGSEPYRQAILDCLHRNHARYQLSPYWDKDLIFNDVHTPGLTPEDFFIALQDEQVIGCLALWDQGKFKQTVVRGYSRWLGNFRRIFNFVSGVVGLPVLPPVNSKISYAYASLLAVDHDSLEVYQALLRNLYNHAVEKGYKYFMLGLCDDHPFLAYTTSKYAHVDYRSLIYLVTWDLDSDPRALLDDRLPAPEIAIL
jgi:ribosomal protein S18 acetylase RimI-like enzyme